MRAPSLFLFILLSTLTVAAQANRPVLFSQPTSTRAIAFESPLFTAEPFSPDSPFPWGSDPRTRVMLFAQNLTLATGEDLSSVTADAEDGQHRLYNLKVEYLGPVPGQEWLTAVVLRLSDDLGDVGDVLMRVTYHGLSSNRVRVGIGHVGGGLPDDPGSAPTPAPPYLISGRITIDGAGLTNVSVSLGGTTGASTKTDDNGAYSFTVNRAGNYTITPSLSFYNFSPQSIAIDNLTGNRTSLNFTATRTTYSISGQLKDVDSSGIPSIAVTLNGGDLTTQIVGTDAQGNYSFTQVKAGYGYTITPAGNNLFTFTPQTIDSLTANSKLDFQAARRAYSLGGHVMEGTRPISGATVALSGWTSVTAVTDANGSYVFTNLQAGRHYKLTPAKAYFDFAPQSQAIESLESNQTIDFKGTPTYHLAGHVTSDVGSGMQGIAVKLGGAESGVFQTAADGAYSITVHTTGDYTLAPAGDNLLSFPPRSISNLASDLQVDFQAARRTYSISGQLKDVDSSGITGIAVTLNGGDLSSQTVGTDAQGVYTFTGAKAGYGYTITPANNRLFTFTPQTIQNLTAISRLDFQAARRTYSLGGHVMEGTRPISGATLTLSGWTSATALTDASGAYFFPNLQAGRDYKLTPAKAPFDFAPQAQPIENILENLTADFKGTPTYNLTGRTTDDVGGGLGGVTITLGGAESGVFQTAADGTYSIAVHTTGDYTVTASAAQNYFTFSTPTRNLQNVDTDRSAYFQASLSLATDPSYVLEFDGTPMTVDCGPFWHPFHPLEDFFWEVWAQPGENAGGTYMISDGYGGAHAVLFGFAFYGSREPNRYQLYGDLWNGSDFVFFSSDEGPAVGEWGHYAVGWDGRQLITYFNGVPVGRAPYSGMRISPGPNWGAGRLLIGGSDHNNLVGRIAQVRGYEERNPREDTSVTAAFIPEAVFGREGNYLGYFFRPSQKIADMSPSYYDGQVHTGRLRGTLYPYGLLLECPNCPLPKFVVDPTAPKFLNSPVNTSAPLDAKPSAPANALVFDSFSRANSTYALGLGGLGSTEGGSTGPKLWQTVQTSAGLEPFGLLNGRAVLLANQTSMAWVQTGSSTGDLDIRVKRHAGEAGSGLDTGIAFRVVDDQNFFFAYTSGDENAPATSRKLTVGYYLGGVRTELVSNFSLAGKWTELQVRARSNGQLTVSTDGEIIYSASSGVMASATGAGLYSFGPGAGLLNRWDDFVVYNLP